MSTLFSRQVRIHAPGDFSALSVDTVPVPDPQPGTICLRQTAIGVNFADVYHRTGRYPLPGLPATVGVEGAGVIESIGAGVTGLQIGQRVAYAGLPAGGYADIRLLPAERAIPLPDTVPDDVAAGAMLRGMAAYMLFHAVWPLQAGQTVLVQAAAGGLGLVLVQWAKALGARVIGTVSNDAKTALATSRGLDHAVNYRHEDFVAAARKFGDGLGVYLAVDGVGGDTFLRTLDAVRSFGMVASVGQLRGDTRPIA
jgi:NADPH:quinone reductase-like Zn-dependent oxidoreductase